MKICGLLKENHIVLNLKSGDKKKILKEFVEELKRRELLFNEKSILTDLLKRERLGSTGLEKGIAVPHALTNEIDESFLALAVVKEGTDFEAVDQMPTYVLLLLLGNKEKPGVQLKTLAHVCRLVKETGVVEKIKEAESPQEICEILKEEEDMIV